MTMPALAGRGRWLLGGGVAVVAIAVVAGAIFVLGSPAVPEALRYVPGDSIAVAEARLDLPGDQLSKLGNLLAHFPGFRDQSTLSTKLDQSLDQVLGDATSGALDYTTKLKPWLSGAAFVGVGPGDASATPSASGGTTPPVPLASGSGIPAGALAGRDAVVVATTDGQVTCSAAIPSPGASPVAYQGATITTTADGRMACAMDGRYALLGTVARVEAALDARRNGTGMDHDATYAQARSALGSDRLATLYVGGRAGSALLAQASLPAGLAVAPVAFPSWLIAGVRAEDDALVADLVVGPTSGGASGQASGTAAALGGSPLPAPTFATMPPPHSSVIAGAIPGNAVLLAEGHGAGVAIQNALAAVAADPQLAGQAQQLEAAMNLAGGPSGLVGWIQDAGLVVLPNPGDAAGGVAGLNGGLVLVAPDDATASAKAGQVVSLLSIAALSGGGSATSEQVDGTTVTNIDLGDLSTLLGQAGASSQLNGISIPSGLHVGLSIAVRGSMILVGTDEAFPRSILDLDAGQALANQPAYQRAIAHASSSNLGELYVGGDALRAFATATIPADQQARWQQDLLPYAEPIDAILVTTTVDGGLSRTRLVVSVVTPPASSPPAGGGSPAPVGPSPS